MTENESANRSSEAGRQMDAFMECEGATHFPSFAAGWNFGKRGLNVEEQDRIFGFAREQLDRSGLSDNDHKFVSAVLDKMREQMLELTNRKPVRNESANRIPKLSYNATARNKYDVLIGSTVIGRVEKIGMHWWAYNLEGLSLAARNSMTEAGEYLLRKYDEQGGRVDGS